MGEERLTSQDGDCSASLPAVSSLEARGSASGMPNGVEGDLLLKTQATGARAAHPRELRAAAVVVTAEPGALLPSWPDIGDWRFNSLPSEEVLN